MEATAKFVQFTEGLPKEMHADISGAARTMYMAHLIMQDKKAGKNSLEILTDRLPATAKECLEDADMQIRKAIEDFYQQKDQSLDEKDLEKYINKKMKDMEPEKRVPFLLNMLAMAPQELMSEEDLKKVAQLRNAGCPEPADVDYLTALTLEMLSGTAGVLTRTTVRAMDKNLDLLKSETVSQFMDMGEEMAEAYALASYVELRSGEKPWGKDSERLTGMPYEIGLAAAASIETSKLMALYANGKVRKEVMEQKLQNLYSAAIRLISERMMDILAGLAVAAMFIASNWWVAFLLYNVLGLTPWIAIIGALVAGYLLTFEGFTWRDYKDFVQGCWDAVQVIWSGISSLWDKLFGEKKQTEQTEAVEEEREVKKAAEDETEEENSDEYVNA